MNLNISDDQFREILNQIKNEDSPVGIDAGKTHVLILQKLLDIEERLSLLEKKLSDKES